MAEIPQTEIARLEIKELATHADFADAVQLQRMVWGWQDLDILPVRFFVVAKSIGGQILGAFDRDFMFGFSLAIPGVKPGNTIYWHSHMLGILPEYRDAGAGRALKLAQREGALARGVDSIEWTFDPLELKNAYFNIQRLGATVRQYLPNQYGTTTSRLHGGLPTDRLLAEWDLHRDPRPPEGGIVEARIPIPAHIQQIKRNDPEQARDIQKRAGERFHELFGRGLSVVGFERSKEFGTYLFGSPVS